VHSILTAVSEELPDVPLYFNLHDMCKTLRTTAPRSEVFRSALVNAGYRCATETGMVLAGVERFDWFWWVHGYIGRLGAGGCMQAAADWHA